MDGICSLCCYRRQMPLDIRHFFRPFPYQNRHDGYVREICGDAGHNIFQNRGFSGPLGGDTIKPLWPLPIGAIKSITRVAKTSLVVSKVSRSSG